MGALKTLALIFICAILATSACVLGVIYSFNFTLLNKEFYNSLISSGNLYEGAVGLVVEGIEKQSPENFSPQARAEIQKLSEDPKLKGWFESEIKRVIGQAIDYLTNKNANEPKLELNLAEIKPQLLPTLEIIFTELLISEGKKDGSLPEGTTDEQLKESLAPQVKLLLGEFEKNLPDKYDLNPPSQSGENGIKALKDIVQAYYFTITGIAIVILVLIGIIFALTGKLKPFLLWTFIPILIASIAGLILALPMSYSPPIPMDDLPLQAAQLMQTALKELASPIITTFVIASLISIGAIVTAVVFLKQPNGSNQK